MNWDNKELNAMIDNVMDPDFSIDLPSSRELLRSYLRYAYALGKSDGFTEGVLAMSPKGAKEAA
jgi:hypothetical protein